MATRSKSLYQKAVTPLVCLALAVALLTFNVIQPRLNLLEIAVSYLFYPFQKGAHRVNLLGDKVQEYFRLLGSLKEENQALKTELVSRRQEIALLKEREAALIRLEPLLNFQRQHPNYETTTAQVIGMAPSNWTNVIIIDKGERDGLQKNMPVVTHQGVVGQVIKVSSHFAKVLLIIDQRSGVGAMVQRTRAVGVLEGQLGKIAQLKYLDPTAEVLPNDMVISSGLGGVFPKGLVLGTVQRVERETTGIYQEIEVSLTVDFSRLEDVLVIKSAHLEEAQSLRNEEEDE